LLPNEASVDWPRNGNCRHALQYNPGKNEMSRLHTHATAVVKLLPGPLQRLIRSTVVTIAEHACLFGFRPKVLARTADDPFGMIERRAVKSIYRSLISDTDSLLQVRAIRQMLARERLKVLSSASGFKTAENTANVIHNGVQYNVDGAKSAPDLDRPSLMVNVVSSIERVWRNIGGLDVLSIGPRSEIEIFALRAAGFKSDRIRALDLFSYSPYVEIGNMHAMPYADNSFDVVLLGWVLAYSRDPAVAAKEVVRVCRDGAIVIASADYVGERKPGTVTEFDNQETRIKDVAQILSYFGEAVGPVYFRHDPELPARHMVMTAFEVDKKHRRDDEAAAAMER
jgi:SAM-dependent methyltransferase